MQYPFIQAVDIEILDMGSQPAAFGGAKSYPTANDEAILEAPLLWGGDARVRASVRIKVGTFVLYLPVEIRDLQVCSTNPIAGTACVLISCSREALKFLTSHSSQGLLFRNVAKVLTFSVLGLQARDLEV